MFIYMGINLNYFFNKKDKSKFEYTIMLCLFISILFIISLTLFPVEFSFNRIFELNLIPFKTVLGFFSKRDFIGILANIIGNIIMFTPLGFFSYIQFKGENLKSIILCLYSAIFVEIIQLILPGRLTDIDDIILNFLGGYIGVLLAIKFVNYINRKQKAHRV
ncbi:VanZ family protein [Paraclostridium sordellii]|uniref:VanZ family protein n=1 Tax=Paraclostridium sordellii TaxID=1505 RepID=UPI002ED52333